MSHYRLYLMIPCFDQYKLAMPAISQTRDRDSNNARHHVSFSKHESSNDMEYPLAHL